MDNDLRIFRMGSFGNFSYELCIVLLLIRSKGIPSSVLERRKRPPLVSSDLSCLAVLRKIAKLESSARLQPGG